METYGVSFEGFEPSCGWPMYRHSLKKAELKYKTKICRELVKSLGDYIGECRVQLGCVDEDARSESALYEDIKWLHEEAQADLSYYRQIKSDIAAVGVDVAIKLSTRKVT